MKNKRLTALTLACLTAGSLLTGCLGAGSAPASSQSAGAEGENPGTQSQNVNSAGEAAPADGQIDTNASFSLRFIGSLGGDERGAMLEDAAAKLNEKWPNVTVVNECTSDYAEKMKLAFSSGEGQELCYLDDLNQQMLEQGGYLMDLTGYIDERGWLGKSIEGAVEFNNLRHPGQYYSVPFLMAPILVYYNKDLFDELGVSVPETVDEFEEILKKAKEAGYVPTECGGNNYYQIGWMAQSMIQNLAPKTEVDDWYYRRTSSDNMKNAFIETYGRIGGWVKAGYFREGFEGINGDDIITLFSQGQTVMTVDGDWSLAQFEMSGLNIGAFAFPPFEKGGENYIVNAVDGAWALNQDLDANETAAALDWIDIFFQDDTAIQWYEGGFTPSVKADFTAAQVSELKKESAAAMEGTQIGFYLDNVKPGFLDYLTKQTQLMTQGQLTAEGLWDALDAEWQKNE